MPSPFVPSHKRRFTAKRVFTDREAPAGQFFAAFEPPPAPDDHRVLVFYGVGGEGKTALVRHLLGRLEAAHASRTAGWAAVNFEDAAMRRPAEALLSVRLQLRQTAGLAFPAFDTAFAQWFGKTYPGADIRQRHPELFRAVSEDAKDALDLLPDLGAMLTDALDEVPGLGFVYKNLHRFHIRYREWLEKKGRETLRGIEALQPDQLLERLPGFMGADIADAIAPMPVRKPLAIIGDTMEAFHRAEGQKAGAFAFRNDRWLRDLVKETPGVLFVLLGRDRLRWAEVEPEWAGVLDQHRLGALSAEDADRFLLDVPVREPEVRARMVEGAKGLPFYLDLQVDLYESLENQGRAPEPEQFGGSEPEILGRLLDHLGDTAARALAVLSHCRRFDEALWLHLGREFMRGLPPFAFGELRGFSFVEELEGGWLSLHALMREALCERTAEGEPVLHERAHRCLFAWWDERCRPADVRSVTPEHELALEEAAFHRAVFDRETFGDWARERGIRFYEAARYGLVRRLWETVLSIEEHAHGSDRPEVARTLGLLGKVRERLGDLAGAREAQERALAINERALGPDHPDVAGALQELGNTLQEQGEYNIALVCLKRAVASLERALGPDHHGVGAALNDLGLTLWRKGELSAALASYERALVIWERALGPDHPSVATTLLNVGNTYQAMGGYDAALARLGRALAIRERVLGPDHPEVGAVLNDLGLTLWRKGELGAALARYERALAILERALGPDHPNVGASLSNLGIIFSIKGEHDAARARLERALAINEHALGQDHPWVANVLLNLSYVDERQGAAATARQRRARAFAIFRARLGDGHPHTELARQSLEAMDAAAGESASLPHP